MEPERLFLSLESWAKATGETQEALGGKGPPIPVLARFPIALWTPSFPSLSGPECPSWAGKDSWLVWDNYTVGCTGTCTVCVHVKGAWQ